jgi:hypothetical protein
MKSRIPTEEFGLADFPIFSTVHHPSCSVAQALLALSVQKAWLQEHFSLMVNKPRNRATEEVFDCNLKTWYFA